MRVILSSVLGRITEGTSVFRAIVKLILFIQSSERKSYKGVTHVGKYKHFWLKFPFVLQRFYNYTPKFHPYFTEHLQPLFNLSCIFPSCWHKVKTRFASNYNTDFDSFLWGILNWSSHNLELEEAHGKEKQVKIMFISFYLPGLTLILFLMILSHCCFQGLWRSCSRCEINLRFCGNNSKIARK